jgi:GT2 family glycosyltransferase
MPTVSVIIPNYDHARFLRQRVDSVFVQSYQDFEVVLLAKAEIQQRRWSLFAVRPL